MNAQSGFTTPEVNGSFNGWCGSACNPMTDANADGIWEVTVDIAAGSYEYKFAADNWLTQENLVPGSPCTVTNSGFTNRTLTVAGDMVIPVSCWGQCGCTTTYDVTFQVDMNNVTDAFTTPNINGTFNGWCGACSPMTDANADGIWEITLQLVAGTYEYKFSADGWNIQETLTPGTTCTLTTGGFTNRVITVGGDEVVPVVCYGACLACGVAVPTHSVTFQVDMNNSTDAFSVVNLNGTFNGWCGGCAPMTDANADGIWEITVVLEEGNYEYKFTADGWNFFETLTEGDPCTVNAAPFVNRSLSVTADATLPVVCYGSCSICTTPVYDVTFQVDMNNVTDPFTTPEVNGQFNSWCGNCAAMSDANADGIWDVTIQLEAGTYEYKFSADAWGIQETLTEGDACTVNAAPFVNRTLTVTGDATLPVVCWASCSACPVEMFDVTFQVDMNNVTDPFTTPEVNGGFNGWCGGCAPMTDANADGIWELVISLPAGTYEYKYAADSWAIQENLAPGSSCTVTNFGFTNRSLVVSADAVLPPVCWASCGSCSEPSYNVTFQVDMNNVPQAFTTPEVNGIFNGWCGGCAPMSDANADGIWEITIPLQAGSYEYKFAADGWAIQESLIEGSSCTVTNFGFTNRLVTVTGNVTLPVVCYGFCSACDLGCTDNVACNFDVNANVNDGSCTYASLAYFVDADNDGYGAGSEVLFCSNPGAGYSALNTDCNDGNANIRPGAADLCSNSIDDDCDGIVNDGCYASNNDRASASVVNAVSYPTCLNISGNLAAATEDVVGEGADLWYRFTASSNAARITVVGNTATNTAIEVEDNAGNTVGSVEDASSANGNEVFITDDLTVGAQYWVAVRNAGGVAGSYTVCIQALNSSTCDNGSTFNTLCSSFKARWCGTSKYSAIFTSVSDPSNTYTFSSTSGSYMPLASFVPSVGNTEIGGLQYGESYTVQVSAIYTLSDAAGNTEVYTATPQSSTCTINIAPHPAINLASSYASSGIGNNTRKPNWYISTNVYLCAVASYNWMFISVDPETNEPIASELPIIYNSGSSSRYMQLNSTNIPGLTYGKRYRVHVQPVFAYGNGSYDMSSELYIQMISSGGMTTENNTEAMATRTFVAGASNTEFAVYPNPNNGEVFNLNVSGIAEGLWEMSILDIQGKEVMNGQLISENGINTMIVPTTKLNAGIYMINLTNGSEILSTRLVVR
ncbi:MAG: hypothetical protein RL204_900 [Bacteroidota bacterium]|jgi:1,4-alpha-glucan branching enzyme